MTTTRNSDIGILALIGLPGSGKTTLSESIANHLNSHSCEKKLTQFNVINICYDKLIPQGVANELIGGNTSWQEDRKTVTRKVEDLICVLKEGTSEIDLKHLVGVGEFVVDRSRNTLIIIDDNMYYRSMRYEYYQLARMYQIRYSQIFLECNLQEALERNGKRNATSFVPDEVIQRMMVTLEPPDSNKHSWERNSLTLLSTKPFDIEQSVISFINKCMQDPVKPLEMGNVLEKEMSQLICSTNSVHQADIILRRLVGERMKHFTKSGLNKRELQQRSAVLNNKKHRLLEKIKCRDFQFLDEINKAFKLQCSPVSQDMLQTALLVHLKNELQNELQDA